MKYASAVDEAMEWPNDMTISVEDHDLELLELLFVRAAWSLQVSEDVPRLTSHPDVGSSSRPSSAVGELEQRWAEEWARLISVPPPARNTTRWHDKFGWEGLDQDAF